MKMITLLREAFLFKPTVTPLRGSMISNHIRNKSKDLRQAKERSKDCNQVVSKEIRKAHSVKLRSFKYMIH